MKILFPIGSFYPAQSGGPNNTIYWLAKELINHNIEVYTVTTNDGINTHNISLNQWHKFDYGNVIYINKKTIWNKIKYLQVCYEYVSKVDIVHLTSVFFIPSIFIFIFSLYKNKKIIWSVRGELDSEALIFNSFLKNVYLLIIKIILKSNKNVVFHGTSNQEIHYIKKVFPNIRTVNIPNYLELPKLINTDNNYSKSFLYIGRIHPKKAIENLILACNAIEFRNSDFDLKIAGNDKNEYADKLKKKVKELKLEHKIAFLGHIEGEAKQMLFAQSYFLILPSHTENFGNVVIESLAQGTPVIASKGTPWSLLEQEEIGYWVDNSPQELLRGICQAIALTKEGYHLMREKSLKVIFESFDINKNVHRWIKTYKQ